MNDVILGALIGAVAGVGGASLNSWLLSIYEHSRWRRGKKEEAYSGAIGALIRLRMKMASKSTASSMLILHLYLRLEALPIFCPRRISQKMVADWKEGMDGLIWHPGDELENFAVHAGFFDWADKTIDALRTVAADDLGIV